MTTRKEGPPAERVSETIVAEAVSEPMADRERRAAEGEDYTNRDFDYEAAIDRFLFGDSA